MSDGSVSRMSASRCKRSNSGRAASNTRVYSANTQRGREMARCPSRSKSAVIITCPRYRVVIVRSWRDVKSPGCEGDIDVDLLHHRVCRKSYPAVLHGDAMRDVIGADLAIILVAQPERYRVLLGLPQEARLGDFEGVRPGEPARADAAPQPGRQPGTGGIDSGRLPLAIEAR